MFCCSRAAPPSGRRCRGLCPSQGQEPLQDGRAWQHRSIPAQRRRPGFPCSTRGPWKGLRTRLGSSGPGTRVRDHRARPHSSRRDSRQPAMPPLMTAHRQGHRVPGPWGLTSQHVSTHQPSWAWSPLTLTAQEGDEPEPERPR